MYMPCVVGVLPPSRGTYASHSKCADTPECFLDLQAHWGKCTDWKKVPILLSLGIHVVSLHCNEPHLPLSL